VTESSGQPGYKICAGDKVAHRHKPGKVGSVDDVLTGGASFGPLDLDSEIDRVAWVKWDGENKPTAEPVADLIKWA
jgi:hypothetical protein